MKPRSLFALITRSLVTYSVLVSLLFLGGIVSVYQARLREQRADAAERINLLLQVSLENAMLKRDIPGLREIVERLGRQKGIASVMILNPVGQVRFASDTALLDRSFDLSGRELCSDCVWDGKNAMERNELMSVGTGKSMPVLRSVKTVSNREECRQCHGDNRDNPVNGILVVDHDAQDLRRNALIGAVMLSGLGLIVVLGLVAGIYRVLRTHVLLPVASLTGASQAFASGDFDRRVVPKGDDELSELGRTFNAMADRLRQSLNQLSDRERFVQTLLDALPDAVRVIDSDFRIIRVNRAYLSQLGLEGTPQVGMACHLSSHCSSEPCIPTLTTCPIVALAGKDDQIRFHARHVRKDGSDLLVEVHAVRVDIPMDVHTRSLVIESIRDLDAEVKISHEQRLSELGQLATGVAHEIRNPLSSVAMLLADTDAKLRSGGTPSTDTVLRLIGHEVERCLAITDSLLKLGTPPGLSPQLISLNDIVTDIVPLMRFQAEQAHVEMTVRMDDDLRALAPDSDLRIVLINLIQNAFHAMPKGGRLLISATRTDGTITLAISDSGVGIAQEDLGAIFLPFWSRRADGVQGTGLGLAICRSVLKAMGGSICVASTRGHGATFTITLPDPDVHLEAGDVA